MICRIAFFLIFCTSLFSTEHVSLKTPEISVENIIGTNAGIRPFRKDGVRLEEEQIQNKRIIHNYGYGGSGLTLAFGGSKEVLNLLEKQDDHPKTIAVLGAGAVGLATAYDLLEKGYEVHLYAAQWNPNLTSNVAAGLWTPLTLSEDATLEQKKQNQRLLETSEKRLLNSIGDSPEFAGINLMSYYICTEGLEKAIQGDEVLIHFDNGVTKKAKRSMRLSLDGKQFMDDLFSKVKSKGVILHQRHFHSLDEILDLKEPIIINCLSLGSRELFNDKTFTPVRGQLVYLKPQEGIDYMFWHKVPDHNYFFHISPWNDRLIIGGVSEFDEEEATVKSETISRLIENAKNCLSH